jgi:hypothetical protein
MTGIQRWEAYEEGPKSNGRFVTYADHVEALALAYQRGREYQQKKLTNHDMHSGLACLTNYGQGQRDMLAKCIALIEESVPWSTENWIAVDERAAILTALRALQDKP